MFVRRRRQGPSSIYRGRSIPHTSPSIRLPLTPERFSGCGSERVRSAWCRAFETNLDADGARLPQRRNQCHPGRPQRRRQIDARTLNPFSVSSGSQVFMPRITISCSRKRRRRAWPGGRPEWAACFRDRRRCRPGTPSSRTSQPICHQRACFRDRRRCRPGTPSSRTSQPICPQRIGARGAGVVLDTVVSD